MLAYMQYKACIYVIHIYCTFYIYTHIYIHRMCQQRRLYTSVAVVLLGQNSTPATVDISIDRLPAFTILNGDSRPSVINVAASDNVL